MTNGTPFFQEVLVALAANNHPDFRALRDVCIAVDASNRPAANTALGPLLRTDADGVPLRSLSTALFFELLTRVLMLGWFDEFDRLMEWYTAATSTRSREAILSANWSGVVDRIPEPAPMLTLDELIRQWERHSNALVGALYALDKAPRPPPPPPGPYMGGQITYRGATNQRGYFIPLRDSILSAIEHLVRQLQMLFQQMFELAIRQLEHDRTSVILRRLQKLHNDWVRLLRFIGRFPKAEDLMLTRIRLMEIRPARLAGQPHNFLDAFPRHTARTLEFESFDREATADMLEDVRSFLMEAFTVRKEQMAFYLNAYGEQEDAASPLTDADRRRQKLIAGAHRNQLKIGTDDDLITFLGNLFDATVLEQTGPPTKATPADARATAWEAVIDFLRLYFDRLTAHTKFNVREGPENYLKRSFPRAVTGGAIHDCGVYAVRLAYILLSLSRRIARSSPGALDVRVSWIVLPIHVGLLVQVNQGLLVIHNNAFFPFDTTRLAGLETTWKVVPPGDADPADPAARRMKFLEDLAATVLNPDVDMPLLRFEVIGRSTPVTKAAIFDSYTRLMSKERIFSPLVAARGKPQFQFDLRYLASMGAQRDWQNAVVAPFWNIACRIAWEDMQRELERDFIKNRDPYLARLDAAVSATDDDYQKQLLPEKLDLNDALRGDPKLLAPGVRIVFSERLTKLSRELGSVGTVIQYVLDMRALTQAPAGPMTNLLIRPPFADEVVIPAPN